MRAFLPALVVAGFVCCPSVRAVDYGKIDRTLVKEPAYQSKPKYGLLLFGPEARLRVWIVLDGETVYLDRNGDGDLTAKDKRFAKLDDLKNVELADADGKTRYLISAVGLYKDPKEQGEFLDVNVDIKGPLCYRQYCGLNLSDQPAKAHVAHFHGPLTVGPRTISWKVPPELTLRKGDPKAELSAVIGTMDAPNGCWVVVRTHNGEKSAFDDGVCPVVEIEFPPKEPGGEDHQAALQTRPILLRRPGPRPRAGPRRSRSRQGQGDVHV